MTANGTVPTPRGLLLFPAIRWDGAHGFDGAMEQARRDLALGPGGFVIFGGTAEGVAGLTAELRRMAGGPLLFAADLERGAGQQFTGATQLPPAAALGELNDPTVTRAAAELTAREARALGIDWIYAPVADLDVEPRNPIVGTRAFGADPTRVAAHVAAWIRGCREGGAMACVKHFPGHGRTTVDSHATLPTVDADRATLERDLQPFAAAIAADVDAVMTAHVAYPALDANGAAATLSRGIVTGLLRRELGFSGLVATDALIMEGARQEGEAGVMQAVAAGCDVLLYPTDPAAALAALVAARDRLSARVDEAARRIGAAAQAAARRRRLELEAARAAAGGREPAAETVAAGEVGSDAHRKWAKDVARRSLRASRGAMPVLPGDAVDLYTVDDDVGGPYPAPSRRPLVDALRGHGLRVREYDATAPADRDADGGSGTAPPESPGAAVLAVYADVRAWKGRAGLGEPARRAVADVVERHPGAVIVLFGHARIAAQLPGPVLVAWGGEAVMQEAAADAVAGRAGTVAAL